VTLRLTSVDQLPPAHRERARAQISGDAPKTATTAQAAVPKKQRRKYLNEPVVIDGHTFDSRKEGERYRTLRNMEIAGLIRNLRVHPRYALHADGGKLVGEYEADFEYLQEELLFVEDVKCEHTAETGLYQFKRRFMAAQYGIQIRELVHRWKRKASEGP